MYSIYIYLYFMINLDVYLFAFVIAIELWIPISYDFVCFGDNNDNIIIFIRMVLVYICLFVSRSFNAMSLLPRLVLQFETQVLIVRAFLTKWFASHLFHDIKQLLTNTQHTNMNIFLYVCVCATFTWNSMLRSFLYHSLSYSLYDT